VRVDVVQKHAEGTTTPMKREKEVIEESAESDQQHCYRGTDERDRAEEK